MSLINRVLRELDRRHATDTRSLALPSGVRPLEQRRAHGRWRWLFFLLLAAATAGGATWWIVQRSASRVDPAQVPGPPASLPGAFGRAPAPASPPAPGPSADGGAAPTQPALSEPPSRVGAVTSNAPVATQPSPPPIAKPSPPAPSVREPELAELEERMADKPATGAGPPPTQAEAAFRRGLTLYRQQQAGDAETAWRTALELDSGHDLARRALASLLVSRGNSDGAEQLLADGVRSHPEQSRVALALARLQMNRGSSADALNTLEAGLPYAQENAAYVAMTAQLKARAGQQRDAARLYEAALRLAPDNPIWTIALGQALYADGRTDDAYDVYRRARNLKSLDTQQRAFVERKLRELGG